ncbi:DUF11 domain-containing protein [Ruficoccus amylovorans]|uniref:DUF11 domain-containing protein n=1 Tax=Ruficoccus amylovorans TaxID=1804625 RepID=A0A842HFA3_9BACT|nr:DUF11 domain-containing protein [Ruficoccus amylovorans]MBC2594247.1 DUF11 domain-containing protein [Ruficoccus amylovorans]
MKLSLTLLKSLWVPGVLSAALLLTGCESTKTVSGPEASAGPEGNVHGYSQVEGKAVQTKADSSKAADKSIIYEDDLVVVSKQYLSGSMAGSPFTYKINVKAKQPVTNVVVSEMLPAEIKFQSSDPKASMDQFGMPSWDLEAMKAGDQKDITVTVVPSKIGNFEVCSVVRADPMVCLPIFVGKPEITLAKVGPAAVELGKDASWTITAKNTGNAYADNVVITDKLPEGWTAKSPLSKNVGSLDPGQTATMTVVATATKPGKFVNTATSTFAQGEPVVATAPVLVQQSSLKVTKTGPANGYIFSDVPYTITVTNDGDTTLNNILVVDTLPTDSFVIEGQLAKSATVKDIDNGGRTIVPSMDPTRNVWGYWRPGSTNPQTDDSADVIEWTIDTLAPGASKSFTVNGYATRPITTTNNVTASTGEIKESAQAVTVWRAVPGIHSSIRDSIDPIQVGQETTYTLNALNQSSYETFSVTSQKVSIPSQLKIISVSAGGVISGQTVTFPQVSLAPGKEVTRSITVQAVSAGTVTTKVETMTNFRDDPILDQESTTIY